jgi:hypothetical protein
MRQRGDGLGFPLEALAAGGVVRQQLRPSNAQERDGSTP